MVATVRTRWVKPAQLSARPSFAQAEAESCTRVAMTVAGSGADAVDIVASADGAAQPAVAVAANNTPEGDEMDGKPLHRRRRPLKQARIPGPPLVGSWLAATRLPPSRPLPRCSPRSPARSSAPRLCTSAVDKTEATDDDGSLTGQFTWIIEGFNKMKQPKLYSPVFNSGQYNWCVLGPACQGTCSAALGWSARSSSLAGEHTPRGV